MGSTLSHVSIVRGYEVEKMAAKVEQGGYLEELVEAHYQTVRSMPDDAKELTPDQETATEALWSLVNLERVFFPAKSYVAYRPFPMGLSDNGEAHIFKLKEFSLWIRLNYYQGNLLSESKTLSGATNDNVLRVVADLVRDIPTDPVWISQARQYVEADKSTGGIYSISLEDLKALEDEDPSSTRLSCSRSHFLRDTIEHAVRHSKVNPKMRKHACRTATQLTEVASSVCSSVPPERRDEWLGDWRSSFPSDEVEP
jgi:hypothetical protein